jgi:hypothetical protein
MAARFSDLQTERTNAAMRPNDDEKAMRDGAKARGQAEGDGAARQETLSAERLVNTDNVKGTVGM